MEEKGSRRIGISDRIAFCPDRLPLNGKRVTVMGLGLFGGGVAIARALIRWGARVTITDLRPAEDLSDSMDQLSGWPLLYHLGGHSADDFTTADLIVVNPGVPLESPFLQAAIDAGVPLESEMNLLFKLCRTRTIIGVTGTNGKTTTTALIGEVLTRGPRRVWVGGNIGRPLIEKIDEIVADDIVVLEISSFQLEHLRTIVRSPQVAVITNIAPNHLDRHKTMEHYISAKRAIVEHQRSDDLQVLNADDATVKGFARNETWWFSGLNPVQPGMWAQGERLCFLGPFGQGEIDLADRLLPGRFNLENMAAAALGSFAAWTGPSTDWREACEKVFRSFRGIEHRLEFVVERNGVRFYNDSIATNPESTIAALETLPGPIVLIAGGYDKGLSFDRLARAIQNRVRVLVLTGQTTEAIARAVEEGGGTPEIVREPAFDNAVRLATAAARSGETVLLSPACASYGPFRNFTERGLRFKSLLLSSISS